MQEPSNLDQENTVEEDLNDHRDLQHSDKKMLMHVAIKFLLLFIIIQFYDVLIDLMLLLLDLFFELIHLLIEIIEEILEVIMAETLPTTHHQNEVIIVNAALIIVLFALYKLFHGVRFVYRLKRHIKTDWLNYKRHIIMDWKQLSLISKSKLVSAYCVGFSLIFLLAF